MRLQSYLEAKRITQAQFAAEIGVSLQSIYRYLHTDRVPEPPVMMRIIAATKAAVTANDFHDVASTPATKACPCGHRPAS